jgi:hypothetical protein
MSRLNPFSRRVAQLHTTAQDAIRGHVNAASDAADRAVATLWAELLKALKTTQGPAADYRRLLAILRRIPPAILDTFGARMSRVYRLAHRAAGQSVLAAAPVLLREDQADEDDPLAALKELLLPPAPEDLIWRALAPLIIPADWEALGDGAHDRKLPYQVAAEIANAMSQGQTQFELATALRPYVDGSRVRARRAARTFGMHVAHVAQVDAWGRLGDMVTGYQIHATPNSCPPSRKWHQQRSGTVYYRKPSGAQKGFEQMPRPPMEAPDPAERPAGTPRISWNCLCFLTPVLAMTRPLVRVAA